MKREDIKVEMKVRLLSKSVGIPFEPWFGKQRYGWVESIGSTIWVNRGQNNGVGGSFLDTDLEPFDQTPMQVGETKRVRILDIGEGDWFYKNRQRLIGKEGKFKADNIWGNCKPFVSGYMELDYPIEGLIDTKPACFYKVNLQILDQEADMARHYDKDGVEIPKEADMRYRELKPITPYNILVAGDEGNRCFRDHFDTFLLKFPPASYPFFAVIPLERIELYFQEYPDWPPYFIKHGFIAEEVKEEVTYKCGDEFRVSGENAEFKLFQVEPNRIALMHLDTANRVVEPIVVESISKITQAEFNKVAGDRAQNMKKL